MSTRRRSAALVSIAGMAIGIVTADLTAQPSQTFRAGTSAVAVDVAVRDGRRAVLGLTSNDFELLDDGVAQTIVSTSLDQTPFDLSLVVDTSASLTGKPLEQFKTDVASIAAMLGGDDRLRLVTFSTRAADAFGWTPGGDAPPVARIAAGGATAFYQALAAVLLKLNEPGRRQLVVAMSDGFDNVSLLDAPDILAAARRADAVLHVVLRRLPNDVGARLTWGWVPYVGPGNTGVLRDAAEATGGRLRTASPTAPLIDDFRTALDEFRQSYVLWYTPAGVKRSGWHTIEVRLKSGGHAVRARQGYDAGGGSP